MTDKFYFTVFTPAYNRAKTLPRVFDWLTTGRRTTPAR